VCTEVASGADANFPGETDVETYTGTAGSLMPLTITGGLEKLTAVGTSTGAVSKSTGSAGAKPTGNSTTTGAATSLGADGFMWVSVSLVSLIPVLLWL